MSSRFDYRILPKSPVACPICAGDAFEPLCHTDRYLMGVTTARCAGCGLVMTNPMPSEEALGEFYRHHYRKYYRKLEQPDLSYIRRYALDRRAVYTVGHLAASGLLPEQARVLDVGCGEGSILRAIRLARPAAHVTGVEMYRPFAEFAAAYAACPIHATLDDLPAGAIGSFDLVILSHVLEHVVEPVAFLRQLRSYLRPGGRLFVDVPDVSRYHWLIDLHIAHVYHFSPATLAAAARRAGLAVHDVHPHKPPKLPWCVRLIAAGDNEPPASDPPIAPDTPAAHQRIRGMSKRARLTARCFSAAMGVYELSWSAWGLVTGQHWRMSGHRGWHKLDPLPDPAKAP